MKNLQLKGSRFGGLDAGAQAALRFADEMRDGGKNVSDEAAEAVKRVYGDEGLLEVAMVAGLFHYFNRVNNALKVEVTK
ncbi:MAG: carboxymuconolactone decarboxylase family protein [Planctomycetota bacterium]